ncbi:MAG: 16S rRNA (cytosine(1402)-N(4))-methyltransferase RsmH [Chloroflexi bacterium]|nr:16S rRNA (cytosine(1402)-N(4))-methyltransferase RsmH [Chloroflexota bacterium]
MMAVAAHTYHRPVLVLEVLQALNVKPGSRYIDCTVGEGGHARALLEAAPGGKLLGLDADPHAVSAARGQLQKHARSLVLVNANFSHLEETARERSFVPADGILMDLGLSSLQLEAVGRGFSFQRDEPLDMRYSPDQPVTAADLVNDTSVEELTRIISTYGEEPRARRIARALAEARPLNSSAELARVVSAASGYRRGRTHPATRTFQALRIAVNRELESLESALSQVPSVLASGGRLVVISYHSLEDRLVKEFVRREATDCLCPPSMAACRCGHRATLRPITKKVVRPSSRELSENPRSRSAKLRVAERL